MSWYQVNYIRSKTDGVLNGSASYSLRFLRFFQDLYGGFSELFFPLPCYCFAFEAELRAIIKGTDLASG